MTSNNNKNNNVWDRDAKDGFQPVINNRDNKRYYKKVQPRVDELASSHRRRRHANPPPSPPPSPDSIQSVSPPQPLSRTLGAIAATGRGTVVAPKTQMKNSSIPAGLKNSSSTVLIDLRDADDDVENKMAPSSKRKMIHPFVFDNPSDLESGRTIPKKKSRVVTTTSNNHTSFTTSSSSSSRVTSKPKSVLNRSQNNSMDTGNVQKKFGKKKMAVRKAKDVIDLTDDDKFGTFHFCLMLNLLFTCSYCLTN